MIIGRRIVSPPFATRATLGFLGAICTLAAAAGAGTAPPLPDGFYRFPGIGGGMIVFASEGDLWKVPAGGGVAARLTAYEGDERFPCVSPDGRWIAFTAQYEGNDDVYVMPMTGGEPARLTFHPAADQTIGWTADGQVLFRSRRDHPHGDFRVYTVAPEGGIPQLIPLEPAAWISFEPGGQRLALQKFGNEFHNWKRYQGGRAEDIWVGKLEPLAFDKVTDWSGKDAFPMWAADGRVYFVTDRWGRPNLASMKPDGSDVQRLTQFADYDVRWAAMGEGKIVYQHTMDIWAYDLATGRNQQVPIQLPSDRLQVRERFVDPAANLGGWSLAQDGERITIEARGDVFVARTHKKGLIRRITESSSARTKYPAFAPDGRSIAAWTEVEGEEQLRLYAADNGSAPRQLGKQPAGWHFAPAWSPDGKLLAWGDEKYRLYVADATSGAATAVDQGQWEISRYAWSPDSRYLAYAVLQENLFSQVRVWDARTGTMHPASDPMVNTFAPAWDPQGKFLYYLSDRFINPYLDRFESRFIVDYATLPCVVALQADGTLPFAPRGDTDPAKPEAAKSDVKGAAKKGKTGPESAGETQVTPIRIDFAGLADRLVQVPVEPGDYDALQAIAGKLHWLKSKSRGMMPPAPDDDENPGAELQTYDFDKEKVSTVTAGVLAYRLSGDHKVLVYQTKEGFTRLEAGATEAPKDEAAKDAKLDLSGWTMRIDPRAEWAQMLHEAWRLQRDFFYDVKMHGVDWNGVWQQYGPLTARLSSRDDLEDLLGEMFGELNVGHAYHWGGDARHGKPVGTGLLAADLEYDAASGFWQIRKIYRGDWPDPQWSSPLARPDLHVRPGQWLVAIDGRPLVQGEDYLKRLANRAQQPVELSLNDSPRVEGARRVVVEPVANDTPIRYATWIRETRDYVDKKSHGQVGYIHLYDMGGLGLRQFARDFPPQWNKRGMIIDDRWNHGGFVAQMILSHLDRKTLAVGGTRYGNVDTSPSHAFHGYLACLINHQGGSDCETLALGFQKFGLGPVIGTRTWGGWVGIRGDKPLRDGGMITQPEFGGWDPQGKAWLIEGHGIDPDVELDLGPDGFLHGQDPQLDLAIDRILGEIAKDPKDLPPAPPILPRPLRPAE